MHYERNNNILRRQNQLNVTIFKDKNVVNVKEVDNII